VSTSLSSEVASVPTEYETDPRQVAAELNRRRPNWLVLWGEYTHQFVAFPLFQVPRQTILIAHYPDALVAWMEEIEKRI
jgi:hypothetical protein